MAAKFIMFGQEIRRRRQAKEITQLQLADRVGCLNSFISLLEGGYRPVASFSQAVDLVDALECGDEIEPLLIKAAMGKGSVEIELAELEPPVVAAVVALARRVRLGLDPDTGEKIRRLLAS